VLHRAGDREVLDLRVGKRLIDAIDGAARHAGGIEQPHPVRGGLSARDRGNARVQRSAVLEARLRRCERGLELQLGRVQRAA